RVTSPRSRLHVDTATLGSAISGLTAVRGACHRSRYAVTSGLHMQLREALTLTTTRRHDALHIARSTVDKPTWSMGVEYRPVESLLLRGKVGTAFRAPSLADAFQGLSGYYNSTVDYYRCSLDGYLPGDTDDCSWDNESYFG